MEWRRCRTEVVHGLASYTFMEVARPGTEVPVDVTLREGIEQPGSRVQEANVLFAENVRCERGHIRGEHSEHNAECHVGRSHQEHISVGK